MDWEISFILLSKPFVTKFPYFFPHLFFFISPEDEGIIFFCQQFLLCSVGRDTDSSGPFLELFLCGNSSFVAHSTCCACNLIHA